MTFRSADHHQAKLMHEIGTCHKVTTKVGCALWHPVKVWVHPRANPPPPLPWACSFLNHPARYGKRGKDEGSILVLKYPGKQNESSRCQKYRGFFFLKLTGSAGRISSIFVLMMPNRWSASEEGSSRLWKTNGSPWRPPTVRYTNTLLRQSLPPRLL